MLIFWAFLVFLCVLLYRYLDNWRNYFQDRGIPGPRPSLLVGNLPDIFLKSVPLKLQQWTKIYGTTYGIIEGDLDILQDVFVKKFDMFHGRKPFPLAPDPDHDSKVHVVLARGQRWKRLRATAAPQFAANRLRQIMPVLHCSSDAFLRKMERVHEEAQPVDMYQLYQLFTLDAIAKLAFDEKLDVNLLESTENKPYVQWAKQVFQIPDNPIVFAIVAIASVFPNLSSPSIKIIENFIPNDPANSLITHIEHRVMKRKQELEADSKRHTSTEHSDFIQLFLDAQVDETGDNDGLGYGTGAMQNGATDTWRLAGTAVDKCLSMDEITMQCLVLLLAGYDTTANTLAYTTFLLATNPDKQEKLVQEVRDNVKSMDDITFDLVNNGLPYMEMVLKESLRLYPHASLVNARQCMHSCRAGSLHVDKGVCVWADTWTIHHDKNIWGQDADCFRPERFEPAEHSKRHPLCFLAFGAGPRLCLGRRLAMLEMKTLLCYVLQRYQFDKCSTTEPLKIFGVATIQPERVMVTLK